MLICVILKDVHVVQTCMLGRILAPYCPLSPYVTLANLLCYMAKGDLQYN